ncbi:SitI3 family protein [Paenibacillus sp. ACRSA]|uniref:SitI3 family protein n=1 Tax=Paenibacillus sp. ACRSA TaxID=2918211 RepID=UPI001EF5A961|nr:SitI3 family protein [Paenibacillus sp. ACRSA]MCG7376408.1 SitI3 family protein [Paenibacillus sp. ACRSA]
MALEYSFILEKIQLSNDDLITELGKLGVKLDINKIEKMTKGIQITETNEILGFTLALLDTSDSYFGYESEYFINEFKDQQDLSFRLNKFYDWEKAMINILTIVFELIDNVYSNCIFEFNGDTIYLVKKNEVIYVNNNTSFWDNENFKRFIEHRKFVLLNTNEII